MSSVQPLSGQMQRGYCSCVGTDPEICSVDELGAFDSSTSVCELADLLKEAAITAGYHGYAYPELAHQYARIVELVDTSNC